MLSFHVKFVQTDRRTTVRQYAPDLSIINIIKKDASVQHFALFTQCFLAFPRTVLSFKIQFAICKKNLNFPVLTLFLVKK